MRRKGYDFKLIYSKQVRNDESLAIDLRITPLEQTLIGIRSYRYLKESKT